MSSGSSLSTVSAACGGKGSIRFVGLERHRGNLRHRDARADVGAAAAGDNAIGADAAQQRRDRCSVWRARLAAGESEAERREDTPPSDSIISTCLGSSARC